MSVYGEVQKGAPGAVEFSYQDVRTGKKVTGFYAGVPVLDIEHMASLGIQSVSVAGNQRCYAFVCRLNAKGMQSLRDYLGHKKPARLVAIVNERVATILTADFIRDLVKHNRELEVPFQKADEKAEPSKPAIQKQ